MKKEAMPKFNIKQMKLEITNEIENIILQWKETSATDGDFGLREFYFEVKKSDIFTATESWIFLSGIN